MKTNAAGLRLIKDFEGCSLVAYRCIAGVLTIGYGHTGDVKEGTVITQHQADTILEYDIEKYEAGVMSIGVPLTPNQFAALVALAFNIGTANLVGIKSGPFQKGPSTLVKLLRAGFYLGAADQFLVWNKARVNGVLQPVKGLTRRREAEKALFLSPNGAA